MTRFALLLTALLSLQAADLKYTVVPDFFEKEPGGQPLGPCHGGAVIDKAGNIFTSPPTPRAASSSFRPRANSCAPSARRTSTALEIREENGVEYHLRRAPSATKSSSSSSTASRSGRSNIPKEAGICKDAKGFNPCAVTVAPDGSIFVADGYGSNYVLKFDKDRKFVKAFGGPGEEEGKFKTCHGIALDTRQDKPLLLVCNRNNNRVEHWDLDGNFVKVIQKDLRMPAAVHIRGDYAVVPELQGRVTVLDKAGTIAAQVGDNPNEKQRANFGLPKRLEGRHLQLPARRFHRQRRQPDRHRVDRLRPPPQIRQGEIAQPFCSINWVQHDRILKTLGCSTNREQVMNHSRSRLFQPHLIFRIFGGGLRLSIC